MSFHHRMVRFVVCDGCAQRADKDAPSGWIEYIRKGKVHHNCPRCQKHAEKRIEHQREAQRELAV